MVEAGKVGGRGRPRKAPENRRGRCDDARSNESTGVEAPPRQYVVQRRSAAADSDSGGVETRGRVAAAVVQLDCWGLDPEAEGVERRGVAARTVRPTTAGSCWWRPRSTAPCQALLLAPPPPMLFLPLPLFPPTRRAGLPATAATAATARLQPSCNFPLYGALPCPCPTRLLPAPPAFPSVRPIRPARGDHVFLQQEHSPPPLACPSGAGLRPSRRATVRQRRPPSGRHVAARAGERAAARATRNSFRSPPPRIRARRPPANAATPAP